MPDKTSRRIKIVSVIIIFIIVLLVVLLVAHTKNTNKQVISPDPVVKTETTKKADDTMALEISGFVRGANRADIAPMASGRVIKIYKREGDYVKKGEILAVIDSSVADAQTSAAGSSVQALEKTLSDSKKYYSQMIDQAQAALDDAKKSGGPTDSADEAVKSAKRARDLQIQSVQNQIAIAQGSLGVADANKNNFNVTSPFSGTVSAIYVREGGFANFSAPLFGVSSPGNLELETYLSADNGRNVTTGSAVSLTATNGSPITGTIIAVSPGSDTQTLKTLVRIQLNDPTDSVRLGDFIHGQINVAGSQPAISISKNAVITRGDDSVVFTLDENNIVHEQLIKINGEHGSQVDVTQGLEAGQNIITEGQQFLINGIKVSPYDAK